MVANGSFGSTYSTRPPIDYSTALNSAIAFAVMQSTPQKSRRVYLNTLAVYAVHTYSSCKFFGDNSVNYGRSTLTGK